MSTETHTEAAGLAEALLGHFPVSLEPYRAEMVADAALSWLTARLTDDDVVEAAVDALVMDPLSSGFSTEIGPVRRAARAALSAAADVIGGEA